MISVINATAPIVNNSQGKETERLEIENNTYNSIRIAVKTEKSGNLFFKWCSTEIQTNDGPKKIYVNLSSTHKRLNISYLKIFYLCLSGGLTKEISKRIQNLDTKIKKLKSNEFGEIKENENDDTIVAELNRMPDKNRPLIEPKEKRKNPSENHRNGYTINYINGKSYIRDNNRFACGAFKKAHYASELGAQNEEKLVYLIDEFPNEFEETYTKSYANDPHFPKTLSVAKNGESTIYVQKYYNMGSLQHCINKLTPEEKIKVIRDLLEALAMMHDDKIIHNDIKSDNSLVYRDDEKNVHAVLSDFGSSFQINGDRLILGGDERYDSPQIKKAVRKKKEKIIIANRLLSLKKHPQKNKSEIKRLKKIEMKLNKEITELLSSLSNDIYSFGVMLRRDLSADDLQLTALINTMLDADPEKRPTARIALKTFTETPYVQQVIG